MDAAGLARTVQYLAVAAIGGAGFARWRWQVPWPRAAAVVAGLLGAAGAVAWLAIKALQIAGLEALTDLAVGTSFGRAAVLRTLLLLAAAALAARPRPRWALISVLGAGAAATFAGSGHGGAGVPVLLAADLIHSLAAMLWTGALPALWLAVLDGHDPRRAAQALGAFSAIGPALVGLLAATGLVNAWLLVGPDQAPHLFDSAYGRLLVLKLALFAGMLALAAANRWRLAPALDAAIAEDRTPPAALRWSLTLETALGAGVLAVVGSLGTLPPPGHGG